MTEPAAADAREVKTARPGTRLRYRRVGEGWQVAYYRPPTTSEVEERRKAHRARHGSASEPPSEIYAWAWHVADSASLSQALGQARGHGWECRDCRTDAFYLEAHYPS